MSVVEPFSLAMVERYIQKRGWKFLRDQDGDYRVDFAYSDERGCSLSLWMIAEGAESEIYTVRVYSDKRIPRDDWMHVIRLCNEWNRDRRWPKAYLHAPSDEEMLTAPVHLEYQIDLETGIHQELLEHLTESILSSSHAFWMWMAEEHDI
ncbi:MAG: YbjN domain-containing protein [Chloroflexaceae bacterium]|nr:YbjN domain-containing protein [Chloroflexaceae bacterium]